MEREDMRGEKRGKEMSEREERERGEMTDEREE